MAKNQSEQFEQSLQGLNEIVEQMETGELTLEQSLEHFEKGIKLSKNCQSLLEKAEQKVETLLKNDDNA